MVKTLLKSVREYKIYAILAPLCVAVEVVFECLIPGVVSNIFAVLQNETVELNYILIQSGILLAYSFSALLFGILSGIFAATASSGFAKNLRHDLFVQTQTYSFRNIDKFQVSSLVTRMTTDIMNVKESFQFLIRLVFRGPIMMVVSLVLTFFVSPLYGWLFLAGLVFLAICLILILRFAIPYYKRAFKKYDRLNNDIQENIKGIRVVKSYVREDFEKEKFRKSSEALKSDFYKADRITILNNPVMQFTMYILLVTICAFGSYLIVSTNSQAFKYEYIQQLTTYALNILSSLNMLSMVFIMISMSTESMRRCYEVLIEVPDIQNPKNPVYEVKDGSIEFKDVNFKYSKDAEKFALENINIKIPSGTTVGIFGSTGSSKSSLVNLICRLYDTTEGEVLVGGVNVKDYDLKTLRDNVSVVLQKNVLFKGTIKENLRWGDENATDEEIEQACKLAQADEFIQLFPKKYDHMIEQGGANVSGGQKQRLCIARALLKKPKILILDDSTSAVDTKTDSKIREAFRSYIPDTTKLIIGQRISSIQDSDMILIMDDGHIQQVGTHEELLKTNKIYQEVYASQNNVKGGSLDE